MSAGRGTVTLDRALRLRLGYEPAYVYPDPPRAALRRFPNVGAGLQPGQPSFFPQFFRELVSPSGVKFCRGRAHLSSLREPRQSPAASAGGRRGKFVWTP
jgi:hypothetical protein